MAGIFISYRRSDSAGFAGRLYNDLRELFGSGYIFRDIAMLIPGESFPKAIERALSTCHVLIVVIGQQWLTCVDAKGHRRLDDQDDFVRMEIEGAFRRRMRVIPVLVQGASMPKPQDLPQSLVPLTQLHAVELTDFHWKSDIRRLIETLGKRPIKRRTDNKLLIGGALIMVSVVYVALLLKVPSFRLAMVDFLKGSDTPPVSIPTLAQPFVLIKPILLGLIPASIGVIVITSWWNSRT